MDYAKIKEELKPRLAEYVAQITEKSKGRGMYNCPLCRSGTGRNATGAFSIDPKNPARWHCFACGDGGDLFDLIGKVENISEPVEQLRRAAAIFGISIDGSEHRPAPKPGKTAAQRLQKEERETPVQENLLQYISACHARLSGTDYHTRRGISEETAKRFFLGYDPHHPKFGWSSLIIPTSLASYTARNTDAAAAKGDRFRREGSITLLNIEALKTAEKPVFIVEGELDALSIIEVGGEAVGLGSAVNIRKLAQHLEETKPTQPLILALDNDEAGRKAVAELENMLSDCGVHHYRAEIYGEHKDANEALLADREAFAASIRAAEQKARKAERAEIDSKSAAHHLQAFINGIAASANTPAQSTGFAGVDAVLDGGLYEGLYIIGAITSLGKTTFALQMADQIAASGRDVLIFSLEMARTELMSKSISRLTMLDVLSDPSGEIGNAKTARGITSGARYALYTQRERELIQRAIASYGEYAEHIFIHEGMGDIGIEHIRAEIDKHTRITGTAPVVLVDYLQILAPYEVRATEKQNTDKAVLELKRISRDYKTPVIGISSVNRASYNDAMNFSAYKESGAIEYTADVLIGLQLAGAGGNGFDGTEAKKKNPREIELVILKNRNGSVGNKIPFSYYPLFNYFKEEQGGG